MRNKKRLGECDPQLSLRNWYGMAKKKSLIGKLTGLHTPEALQLFSTVIKEPPEAELLDPDQFVELITR
jgi:hypothetical protein